ncbi:MAG: hypothetical protein AB7Y46_18240 [Armatimonadota bacterium]
MKPRPEPAPSGDLQRLLARQRRRHLVAQFMTARRWATQLGDVLLEGASPTGYGPPMAPLPREEAQRVLAPVEELLECLHRFVQEQAPEELEEAGRPRSEAHTRLWARNLLARLADTVEGLTREAARAGDGAAWRESADRLARAAPPLIHAAREALAATDAGASSRDGSPPPHDRMDHAPRGRRR